MASIMSEKIPEILKECQHTPGLESFTSKPAEVTIEEDPLFLDGYSSVIVRLRAGDGSTVIAKHAPPYLRAFGESMPLPETRAEIEMTGLQMLERYIPGAAPKLFFFSKKHNTTLMEDLVGYKTLQSEVLAGNVSKVAIGSIAEQLARLHRSTHKNNISKEEWTKLEETFKKSRPLAEQIKQVIMSYPYSSDPQDDVAKQLKHIADSRVFGDSKLNQLLVKFKEDFVNDQECLIHGDPQIQNMMVKEDYVKMIDLEGARLGTCSHDVGGIFADLILAYYRNLISTEDVASHRRMAQKLQECSYHLVNTYVDHMSWSSDTDDQHVAKFMRGFALNIGISIFLSIGFGIRAFLGACQIQFLDAGIRLMEQHHVVDSVDKIYSILALEGTK